MLLVEHGGIDGAGQPAPEHRVGVAMCLEQFPPCSHRNSEGRGHAVRRNSVVGAKGHGLRALPLHRMRRLGGSSRRQPRVDRHGHVHVARAVGVAHARITGAAGGDGDLLRAPVDHRQPMTWWRGDKAPQPSGRAEDVLRRGRLIASGLGPQRREPVSVAAVRADRQAGGAHLRQGQCQLTKRRQYRIGFRLRLEDLLL